MSEARRSPAPPRPPRRRLAWGAFYAAMLAVAVLLLASGPSRGETATATASARVVAPANIRIDRTLSFGLVRGGHRDGAIGVDFLGRRRVFGGAIALPGAPWPASGGYWVTGEPGAAFTVLTPTSLIVPGEAGAAPLTVSNFAVYSVNLRRAGGGGRFDSSGRDRLLLSARLSVPARAPAGAYRAEIPLVVSYQ